MSRILIGIGVLTLSIAVAAQGKKEQPGLGAVAKATQEEKAKAAPDGKAESKPAATSGAASKTAAENNAKATAAKKYTNENLDGRPRPSSPSAHRTAMTGAAMVSSEGGSQDETYWRSRAEPLRQRLQYSTDRLNSAKAQLEQAKNEGGLYVPPSNTGRTSSVQAERMRLSSRVSELEAEVRRDREAWTNFEAEAKRAGAMPGWLR